MAASSVGSTPLTLMHFILSSQQEHPEATGDFTISKGFLFFFPLGRVLILRSLVLHSIEMASKFVSAKVRAAGLLDLYGEEGPPSKSKSSYYRLMRTKGTTNVQGEKVKKLDTIANEAFITSLKRSQKASEILLFS